MIIGAPIGLFGIAAIVFVPSFFFSDGLLSMVIINQFGISILGASIAFLVSLWLGGRLIYRNISKGKPLLLTSFKYALQVNLIIWTVFYLFALFTAGDVNFLLLSATAVVCLVCTVFTTFTLGLWISYEIKRIVAS